MTTLSFGYIFNGIPTLGSAISMIFLLCLISNNLMKLIFRFLSFILIYKSNNTNYSVNLSISNSTYYSLYLILV